MKHGGIPPAQGVNRRTPKDHLIDISGRFVCRPLLHCEMCGHAEQSRRASDPSGEFDERRGDPQSGADAYSEFVVAAAQILREGVAGDHDLRDPSSL